MFERLRLLFSDDVPKTGHEYYDMLSGVRFEIRSVRKSDIEIRHNGGTVEVDRENFLRGYRLSFIRHAKSCDACKKRD